MYFPAAICAAVADRDSKKCMKKEIIVQEQDIEGSVVTVKKENNPVIREEILTLEEKLKKIPGALIGHEADKLCTLEHSFADGVYVRKIFIPKGQLIVGKIHRHSHPNFLMKGDVSVLTEGGAKRIKAPASMISPAGTKRVVYTHEDSVWITVHVTDETDLDRIEDVVIAKEYKDLLPTSEEIIELKEV